MGGWRPVVRLNEKGAKYTDEAGLFHPVYVESQNRI
jgi:hypothetical protein